MAQLLRFDDVATVVDVLELPGVLVRCLVIRGDARQIAHEAERTKAISTSEYCDGGLRGTCF